MPSVLPRSREQVSYDAENRIVGGGTSATYAYDATGQRINKTVGTGGVNYLYDLAGNEIMELSAANGSWNLGEVYTPGGMHFATYAAGETYFAQTNWLGTERARKNQAGTTVQYCDWTVSGEYISCGNLYTYQTPTAISSHTFAGYEYDAETKLYHTQFRYYNPHIGRWMSADPYMGSMDIGNPQSMNRFAYVTNDPMNHYDPDGLNQDGFCSASEETCGGADGRPGSSPGVGTGGGFGSGFNDTLYGDWMTPGTLTTYLGAVAANFTWTTDVTCVDGTNVTLSGSITKEQAGAANACAGHDGNVAVYVGSRRIKNKLLAILSLGLAGHSFYGFGTGSDDCTAQYEVLGPDQRHQQVTETCNQPNQSHGGESLYHVSQAQADALRNRSDYFATPGNICPTCGSHYLFFLDNSNSFVYNMLSRNPAGGFAPQTGPFILPGFYRWPGQWYQ